MKNGYCLALLIRLKGLSVFWSPKDNAAHLQGGIGNYLYLDYLLITWIWWHSHRTSEKPCNLVVSVEFVLLWPLQVLLGKWAWTVKFIFSVFPNWGAFRSVSLQWVSICSWGWLYLFVIRVETMTKWWWIFLVTVIADILNGLYCQETWLLTQWEQALFLEV